MPRIKGVLRIAIEDFLETFDLGTIWFRWYTTLLEKFENEALDTYKEIADKLNITQFLPDILSPDGMRNRMTKRPVQIIPIIIAVGMMVIVPADEFKKFMKKLNLGCGDKILPGSLRHHDDCMFPLIQPPLEVLAKGHLEGHLHRQHK